MQNVNRVSFDGVAPSLQRPTAATIIARLGNRRAFEVSCSPEPDACEVSVVKPNYMFEKRQRELAKKKKKEEKARRKLDKSAPPDDATVRSAPDNAGVSTENT